MSALQSKPYIRKQPTFYAVLLAFLKWWKPNKQYRMNSTRSEVSGYLLKQTPPARLLDSLREVASGGAPMSPEIARRVVELFREFSSPADADYRLTPQESTLLRLLVDGRHKKTAAKAMGISVNTVSFHLKNIYVKLQVHSKTEAVAKALLERLL